ncbi:hypothetical protein [Okeania sp. SIO2C2]|uniref:hypothetical protein n=1 Tax=Okeania sp. SIO2C2 TaxID=2607787 RepID=UPI002579585C|nr:hypothetical protein [Okeania sp. SIO2C2]
MSRLEKLMGRWGDGGMGSVGEIKKYISSPLPCRTTKMIIVVVIRSEQQLLSALLQRNGMTSDFVNAVAIYHVCTLSFV